MKIAKAAQIATVLALLPALYAAYALWAALRPHHSVSEANITAIIASIGAFLGLFLVGAMLSIIALIRGMR